MSPPSQMVYRHRTRSIAARPHVVAVTEMVGMSTIWKHSRAKATRNVTTLGRAVELVSQVQSANHPSHVRPHKQRVRQAIHYGQCLQPELWVSPACQICDLVTRGSALRTTHDAGNGAHGVGSCLFGFDTVLTDQQHSNHGGSDASNGRYKAGNLRRCPWTIATVHIIYGHKRYVGVEQDSCLFP